MFKSLRHKGYLHLLLNDTNTTVDNLRQPKNLYGRDKTPKIIHKETYLK